METVTVNVDTGMHARPASVFVQTAAKYPCEIQVEKDGEQVNGKSIMGLLMLAPVKGAVLKISAEGEKEKEAVQALVQLVNSDFKSDL
ncbi:MAG: HPr family phosphocarrier protein [Leptospirales bacterium]